MPIKMAMPINDKKLPGKEAGCREQPHVIPPVQPQFQAQQQHHKKKKGLDNAGDDAIHFAKQDGSGFNPQFQVIGTVYQGINGVIGGRPGRSIRA